MTQTATPRLDWVDHAKGAAIILVVIGHTWRGLFNSGLVQDPLFTAVDARIYAFHMPVFFALSGLFYIQTLSRAAPPVFVLKRMQRLLWPMILWTYLFLGTKALAGQFANSPMALRDVFIMPLPGQLHLWFLWALFVLSMAFALLHPFVKEGRLPGRVMWIVAGLLLVLQGVRFPSDVAYWVGIAKVNAPFLFLGIVLGQTDILARLPKGAAAALGAAFVILVAGWPWVAASGFGTLGSLILTFAFLALFSQMAVRIGTVPNRVLTVLGAASMAIYLAHTIFSATLREVLLVLGIQDLGVHMLLGTLIGLIAPLAVLAIARRTGTKSLLGF